MFDVHLFGAERVSRAVAGAMGAQAGGTIVNVVSAVAWVPMPGASAYCAAKAAVVALSESLRAELADAGIDVRVFAPPFTRTDPDRQWPLDRTKVFERGSRTSWFAPCAAAGLACSRAARNRSRTRCSRSLRATWRRTRTP